MIEKASIRTTCAREGYLCCLGFIATDSVAWARAGNPRGPSCGPCQCACHASPAGPDDRGEEDRQAFDRVTGAFLVGNLAPIAGVS